jgi:hypothetical protein
MYSNYLPLSGPEMQYQQMPSQQYYQQQTLELMNNSVCSSDSQTLSPPMHPSSANHSINNSAQFNYNLSAMNSYPQNGYYPNGMYAADMNGTQPWYPTNYYSSSSKVPSYSNGANSLEFSPNSDQSMHNFGSPPDAHPSTVPPQASNNPAAIYYQQSSHPTIV